MAESKASRPRRSGIGLFDSVRALLASLVSIAHNRLALLSTELQEEIARVAVLLLWGAVGVFFAFLGIAFIAVAILIVFWDDHRLLVALLLAALFAILGVVAGFTAWKQIAAKPRPFDASLGELGKDREQLKARS